MRIRFTFNNYYLNDLYVHLKGVPRKKEAIIIPYEMLKFKDEEKAKINDDVFIVYEVMWDLEDKEVCIMLK
jgi:hypothetical protein